MDTMHTVCLTIRLFLVAMAFSVLTRAVWVDRFDGDVLDACWGRDLPQPAKARITLDTESHGVRLITTTNTDMWGSRADAPILWIPRPPGDFIVETHVTGNPADDGFVAGLTVYGDGGDDDDGKLPNFSYGLDHWNGSNRMVKLQGLGTNQPSDNAPVVDGEVWLRLEYSTVGDDGQPHDLYRALYKLKEADSWQELATLARQVPNARVGLFLKSSVARTVEFSYVSFEDFCTDGAFDPDAVAAYHAERRKRAAEIARRKLLDASIGSVSALRTAVAAAISSTGEDYPEGQGILAELATLERRIKGTDTAAAEAAATRFALLQREAILAHPVISHTPVLFVVRPQYRGDHHNTATMFQTGEINTGSFTGGGALKVIDLARGGEIRVVLDEPNGVIRDPDVYFDGKKILFSMRRSAVDDYHIYEINSDGSDLKQLTFGAGISDIDPLYLPDDRIAFSSTREPKFCMCNRHIMGNLFRMDSDGANIHQIGHSTLHEGHGTLTPDGRVLYDRWEYVDRNFGDAQGLWTTNPDGTAHLVYFGNNTSSPGGILDARILPDAHRFIATFSSCHDRPWGAIALVDRRLGIDGREPVLRTWPAGAIDLVMKGNYDTFTQVQPKYEDPYPLSNEQFLCVRQVEGEQMGIVLLDVFGNEILLHTEAPGCFDPMPLAPRQRPPVIPDRINLARTAGTFAVYDVYQGTGMETVERGTVKWVRVVESPEKRFWTHTAWAGGGTQAPGMAWDDFNNKRILGTAPVEADGSAHFSVPADRFLYFQLLDEKGMMVQSMRSGTIARPGETTGCAGCHENRLSAPPSSTKLAFARPPSPLQPWHGEERLYGYLQEMQPVFDKHCIRCHDFGGDGGKKVVLAGDLTLAFNVSYMEIRRKQLVHVPGAGPAETLMPYSWGSHASPMVATLLKGHNDVELDPESWDRLVTWIDINAPYYPRYASAYPANLYGRSPLDDAQLRAVGGLTGVDLTQQSLEPRICFDRPDKSPLLAGLQSRDKAAYAKALAIIEAGKTMLAQRPRADMPDFDLLGIEAAREAKYQALRCDERESREAIIAGLKKSSH